ncbi:MAG: superoxide dismutase [Candidatus Sumerlaeia bacterium]|nr:superoxide dismutase [Candidatus Sumerlaeia bacterium]
MASEAIGRRDFLAGAAVFGAAAALSPLGAAAQEAAAGKGFAALFPGAAGADGKYALPALPYAYDALEAAIDAQTMELHHSKHHAGYVNGANANLAALAKARETGDFAQVEALSKKLTFNAGGHLLHCVFWDCMGPDGGGAPTGDLAKALDAEFGSFDAFWAHFAAATKAVEGSGWGKLSYDLSTGRLFISQGQNQNLLTTFGEVPLLALDVWEHAYYLRYQNRRADYVDAWRNVVDWRRVGARYEALRTAG